MGGGIVKNMGRFHHRFAESGMRMDGQPQVGDIGPHFDGQNAFGDQLARAQADDADT